MMVLFAGKRLGDWHATEKIQVFVTDHPIGLKLAMGLRGTSEKTKTTGNILP